MSTIQDYNLALIQVTVGDFRVTGWAEGDAISIVPLSDLIEHKASADGSHVAVSRKTDNRHEATFTVMHGTAAYKLLMDKAQAQVAQADSGAVDPLSLQVYDPITGHKIAEANARFVRFPDISFGATAAGDGEFKLLLPNPTITATPNVPTN